MYRKKLSKASQEWLWTEADQNDSFSDSSYKFPIQRILQNEVMTARTQANSILDFGNFGCLVVVGSNSETCLERTITLHYDAVIDCLIKWVQLAPAFDHSPALNRSSLCLDTADLLSLFLYQFSLSFSPCYEPNFLFRPVSKTSRGGVNNFRATLVLQLSYKRICSRNYESFS